MTPPRPVPMVLARPRGLAALAAMVVVALGFAACSPDVRHSLLPNHLPEVEITEAPVDTNVTCAPGPARNCYAISVRWTGFDFDGQIDHYRIAIDPPANGDTTWIVTRESRYRAVLPAAEGIPFGTNQIPMSRQFHVFVVEAVDNLQSVGPPAFRAFFAYTQAPTVLIQQPHPDRLATVKLTPTVRISWKGEDVDGVATKLPVKYKYTLLSAGSRFPIQTAVSKPDSFRDVFAPNFAGWDSIEGSVTSVQFTGLTPDQEYVFAIVAFDEAGAWSPVFNLDTNMLRFRVGIAANLGPTITASSDFFEYTWLRSSYCPTCASSEFAMEMPAGRTITVNWSAVTTSGSDVRSYRWAVDIGDVSDQSGRTDENDLAHWSSPSLNIKSATIGPFLGLEGGESHRLYIEATDNAGLSSLAIVRLQVISPNFRPGSILVVKDTRFVLDAADPARPGCVRKPQAGSGGWPTQAELDTFLFARGGYPWKCLPTGTISRPGLFAEYSVDTMSTRPRQADLSIKLAKLARYEHVIWMVDGRGASAATGTGLTNDPTPALRYMCEPGRFNSLAGYVLLGGKAWVLGGGSAYASTFYWNVLSNDLSGKVFSFDKGEVVPSRMMYDQTLWRSEFKSRVSVGSPRRYLGRFENGFDPTLAYTRYLAELPQRIEYKSPSTDTMPAWRTNTSDFFKSTVFLEYLQKPNLVTEQTGSDPDHPVTVSILDTLYEVSGADLPFPAENPHNASMTYAHGSRFPQGFVFSGFDIWTFKRSQCKALVDFVLRRMWNLTPRTAMARASR